MIHLQIKHLPFLLVICSFIFIPNTFSQEDSINAYQKYFQMSVEDLLNIEVNTGTLINTPWQDIPVTVTTLTSEDISVTPARNILDLIEIYVPGAIWVNHYEGQHPGWRGIIADRNYKFLLLINGVNINEKSHDGAATELENWDLSDIDRIEIIRGPGSVTYGPGAIMGVISITTKNYRSADNNVKGQYITNYNSYGINLTEVQSYKKIDFYSFVGITRTEGFTPNAFSGFTNDSLANYMVGYIGKDAGVLKPTTYFRDYNDNPQVKVHMEFNYGDNWRLWARYTNSGTSINGDLPQSCPPLGYINDTTPLLGTAQDIAQLRHRQFTTALENNFRISKKLNLLSRLSWYTEDFERRTVVFEHFKSYSEYIQSPEKFPNNISDPRLYSQNYAENELLLHSQLNYEISKKINSAIGFEYAINTLGKGWGDDIREMVIGDNYGIISDSASYFYKLKPNVDTAIFIGNNATSTLFSAFGEFSYTFSKQLSILISARADKHSYNDWLFSPRVALISHIGNTSTLKLMMQHSNRLNTYSQLLYQHETNKKPEHEVLDGVELAFTKLFTKNMLVTLNSYYNQINYLSWDENIRQTRLTGDLQLAGLELEFLWKTKYSLLGFNHSITIPIDWTLEDSTIAQGISVSDYFLQAHYNSSGDTTLIKGYGNHLMNWSDQATKAWLNLKFFKSALVWHTDAHVFWAFEGGKDALKMIENASRGTESEQLVDEYIKEIESTDAYGIDFRLNTSLTCYIGNKISLTGSIYNLLGTCKNKRYTMWKFWYQYPTVGFVEEPRVYSIRMQINF